ncbi:MAG: hypothetical protein JST44_25150 [Cyanobacteria bacterium SZAS LIN-5]|nr:hypothetical protein [Cyanobacteria bacterium SZAS LIN-5]RTL41012.1 MAG: hypothetical protein EKK48_14870 [Candidatus Melainabacteria bacterium]
MPFNDSLDFAPSLAKLRGESKPFHVILSGYLRSSRTFELYATLENLEGLPSRLLPFELVGSAGIESDSVVRDCLTELFQSLREEENFGSIMVSDPFKRIVQSFVDEISLQAKRCGAVNVVLKRGNRLYGDNFDGQAFVSGAGQAHGLDFEGKKMLFFGCGGVSSAVATQLSGDLKRVGLVDLNERDANALKQILQSHNSAIELEIFPAQGNRDFRDFDYFYNGTGLGKSDEKSPITSADLFNGNGIAFDANYTPSMTPFLKHLRGLGLDSINGLSHMLMCTSMHLSAATGQTVSYATVRRAYEKMDHR